MTMNHPAKLTALSQSAGCAAKIGPETLAQILHQLPKFSHPNLLVGVETSDDAAIYKISETEAVIQTLDFFTPVVDDPYTYGQIAATNALSDVYAMGGRPLLALNIVAFPSQLDPSILGEILKGGADKVMEAGAVLAGGHSITDDEPKYGLSVMGMVKLDEVLTNVGLNEGDVLILTKPIGTGILNTCLKEGLVSDADYEALIKSMTTLNAFGIEAAKKAGVKLHACTDVTGFGLLGHLKEMIGDCDLDIHLDFSQVPVLNGAIDFASIGLIPAGTYRNSAYVKGRVDFEEGLPDYAMDILFDPQTSGGLVLAVSKDDAPTLMAELTSISKLPFARIGEVVKSTEATGKIIVRP